MKNNKINIIKIILIVVLIVPITAFATDGEQNADILNEQQEDEEQLQENMLEIIDMPLDNGNPDRVENLTHVMVHFMSCVTINAENPYDVQQNYNVLKTYGVGPHYMIDRQGVIYKFLDENRVAYHAGKGEIEGLPEYTNRMNEYSIGIEMLAIGSFDDMSLYLSKKEYDALDEDLLGYTEEQYESLNLLLNDIIIRNPNLIVDRQHILGHEDYTDRKNDPGELFDWGRIECLKQIEEQEEKQLEDFYDFYLVLN